MAVKWFCIYIAAVVMGMLCIGVSAQSGNSCTSELVTLSPCLNYITGNESTPTSSCCSPLASVVKSDPRCLCLLLDGNSSSSLGLSINQTRALGLPATCNVRTPPISQCKVAGSPSSSPSTPSAPSVPSGGGPKTVPTAGSGSSDGSSTKIPLPLIFSLLAIAVYSPLANSISI